MDERQPDGLDEALTEAARARVARLDAAERSARGVVHTPLTVARFMLARLDAALRVGGLDEGLSGDVQLVDPACGPGVFVAAAREAGARHVLGLDRDGAALDDASRILREAGLARGVRLAEADTLSGPAPLTRAEARRRARAVVGNPPWAGRSANREAAYTEALLDDFRKEPDGRRLDERKRGVLSDDYVRFWRWACEEVRGAEVGAVALVTNSSFLDGPVHRGMRARLMAWFEALEVIDLGGSALVAKRRSRDDNLFGVRPGAAVVIAVGRRGRGDAEVRRAAIRGSRADKLDVLRRAVRRGVPRGSVEAELIRPAPPLFAWGAPLVPAPAYESWPALPALMPFHREGLQTNRDAFCVDADRAALEARLASFARGEAPQPGRAHLASRHYDPEVARAALAGADLAATLRPIAYRPLDRRWVTVHPAVCHRPRPALLRAMDRSAFAILTVRKDRGERAWAHFGATAEAVDNCWLSSRSSCRTRAFPTHDPDGAPNLGPAARAWGVGDPATLADYVLACLASVSYRTRYDARLRRDYPRVPPPGDALARVAEAGRAVREALQDPADLAGPEVRLGHRVVRGDRLARALEVAERAVAPLLACHGR